MRQHGMGLVAILVSLILFLPCSALAVPLDDLIHQNITQVDMLFSNVSASLFVFGNGMPRDLSEIDVSGVTVNGSMDCEWAQDFSGQPAEPRMV